MSKQKSRKVRHIDQAPPEPNFWNKLFRFFFPKDWKGELMKGRMAGEQLRQGKISPKVVPSFWLGKGIRKLVDPKHELKIGKKK